MRRYFVKKCYFNDIIFGVAADRRLSKAKSLLICYRQMQNLFSRNDFLNFFLVAFI